MLHMTRSPAKAVVLVVMVFFIIMDMGRADSRQNQFWQQLWDALSQDRCATFVAQALCYAKAQALTDPMRQGRPGGGLIGPQFAP